MAIIRLPTSIRNQMVSVLAAKADEALTPGEIHIFGGTIPADGDASAFGNPLLAVVTLADPGFGEASNGTITANAIISVNTVRESGTATWGRLVSGTDAKAAYFDVTGPGGGGVMQLNDVNLVKDGLIEITDFTLTMPGE